MGSCLNFEAVPGHDRIVLLSPTIAIWQTKRPSQYIYRICLRDLACEVIDADLQYRRDLAATNPRGIPYAPFVDRVEDYVTTRADVEKTLKNFQEMISYECKSLRNGWGS